MGIRENYTVNRGFPPQKQGAGFCMTSFGPLGFPGIKIGLDFFFSSNMIVPEVHSLPCLSSKVWNQNERDPFKSGCLAIVDE